MTCPPSPSHQQFKDDNNNSNGDHFDYDSESLQILQNNPSRYWQHFRTQEYDQWGKSYQDVQKLMTPWKTRVFGHLENGSVIYESACGIGLNLYMTLELVYQLFNITDIVVYGNEYVPSSVQVARTILGGGNNNSSSSNSQSQQFALPGNGRLGAICPGDSSNLQEFVPSNAFDLAYTGYITPLRDPLKTGLPDDQIDDYYSKLCRHHQSRTRTNSKHHDLHLIQQRRQQQRIQEDWYAAWVSELIRITKPGGWIVVEQVSRPLCEAPFDWGGVDEAFWYRLIRNYYSTTNSMDPETVEFAKDLVFRRRYHVRFRKSSSWLVY